MVGRSPGGEVEKNQGGGEKKTDGEFFLSGELSATIGDGVWDLGVWGSPHPDSLFAFFFSV